MPFDDYILVDPIKEYHRVILIGDFMQDIAPVLWPPGNYFLVMEIR